MITKSHKARKPVQTSKETEEAPKKKKKKKKKKLGDPSPGVLQGRRRVLGDGQSGSSLPKRSGLTPRTTEKMREGVLFFKNFMSKIIYWTCFVPPVSGSQLTWTSSKSICHAIRLDPKLGSLAPGLWDFSSYKVLLFSKHLLTLYYYKFGGMFD